MANINRDVRVVCGKNRGVVGVVISDNASRRQYIIRTTSGNKISAKYEFVSFPEDLLAGFKNMFEFKHVLVNSGEPMFLGVAGLVSLVYKEDDQFLANVVSNGNYVVVPLHALSIIKPFNVKA